MPKTLDSADLFYREGKSDKEYHLQIVEEAGGYLVNFQYGRRGSTLNPGCKTKAPVSEEAARKVFNKIVAEKTSEGYTAGASSGGSYTTASTQQAPPPMSDRIVPQLLNPIDEVEMERLLKDDAYGCQEKKDGKHLTLHKFADVVVAANKKGIETSFPGIFSSAFDQSGLYDGESIGDIYHVFDLLEHGVRDLRPLSYLDRYKILEGLCCGQTSGAIKLVPLAIGYKAKKALLDKLQAEKREGIVFKKLAASFTAGKAHNDMAKYKFYSTASVIVVKHNDKDSIAMGLLDTDGKVIGVGNVTTIGHVRSPVGSTIEVRYLYAYKGGCLYQPTYIGPRDDVDYNECSFEKQLIKFKAVEEG